MTLSVQIAYFNLHCRVSDGCRFTADDKPRAGGFLKGSVGQCGLAFADEAVVKNSF